MSTRYPELDDAHLHLHFQELDSVSGGLPKTRKGRLCVNATSWADWDAVTQLALEFENVVPFLGIHPWEVTDSVPEERFAELEERLRQLPGAGVGEIGLDRWIRNANRVAQREALMAQLDIAVRLNRPVSLHCLRAFGELIEIFRISGIESNRCLFHAFGGPREAWKNYLETGAYFSFNPYFCRPDKSAKLDFFRHVPRERLLIETDAPSMAPPEGPQWSFVTGVGSGDVFVSHPDNLFPALEALAELRAERPEELVVVLKSNVDAWLGVSPGV